jgi:predicted nucleic acid-binding protein
VRALATTPWLTTVPNLQVPASIQSWDLGPGETAVLSWAMARGGLAIVDDMPARRCAIAHRIHVQGTLGLVLAAKKKGLIPAARPVLDELRQVGMYLSDAVTNRALALVGE